MKRVVAQFRPPWRPGRGLLAASAGLSVLAAVGVGGVVWEYRQFVALRAQVAQLVEADRTGAVPAAPRPTPLYDAGARQFLSERSAGWAPMLRTLESGAMIGVTPSAVEFNAADGVARVTLSYDDSSALLGYLGRINEGVSTGEGLARWTLVETRMQPGALPNAAPAGAGVPQTVAAQSVATIRSVWQETGPASSQTAP
jgi:hypothetical protein